MAATKIVGRATQTWKWGCNDEAIKGGHLPRHQVLKHSRRKRVNVTIMQVNLCWVKLWKSLRKKNLAAINSNLINNDRLMKQTIDQQRDKQNKIYTFFAKYFLLLKKIHFAKNFQESHRTTVFAIRRKIFDRIKKKTFFCNYYLL